MLTWWLNPGILNGPIDRILQHLGIDADLSQHAVAISAVQRLGSARLW